MCRKFYTGEKPSKKAFQNHNKLHNLKVKNLQILQNKYIFMSRTLVG